METFKIQEKNKKIWTVLGALILFVLPLWRINIGVDITDVGYSFGNFEKFTSMEGMWVLATYLSNVVGHFFTLLPFGHTMIGMNFYTGLVLSLILVFSYFFLGKILPQWLVFIGEILAFSLCWCPTAILYNYLTYLFMTLALYFLYKGILKDKTWSLILAGALLGLNVFVRFPNLAEMGFIVILWYDAIVQKNGWKKGIQDTLKCIGGYIIGFASIFAIVLMIYGFEQYQGMLASLTNVGSNIDGYGPIQMIMSVVSHYLQHLSWIWIPALCVLVIQLIYIKLKNTILKVVTCVLGGGTFVTIFAYFYYKANLFSRNGYNDYSSIYFWAMFFLLISLIVNLFLLIKKEERREVKLLATISTMVIVLTPLGSNNAVYSNFNNLFLVAPLTFYGLYKYILQKKLSKKYLPLQYAILIMLVVTVFQSFMFKSVFTFRDAGLTGVDTVITENEVLKGMKTTAERAKSLEDFTKYIEEEALNEREAVIFGEAPAIAYYMQLEPGISSTWPDLDSYSSDELACSLRQASVPIVIINKETYPDIREYSGSDIDKKASLIAIYLQEFDYTLIYDNYEFQIYDIK